MTPLRPLFAAVVALAVAPVQAASFSTASMSNFAITLFDLNPADGITPGITFTEPYIGDRRKSLYKAEILQASPSRSPVPGRST